MSHREYHRPTLPGAVPQEYARSPTPVCLVNQDGSARRRDDTDDTGAQQRRMPAQDANGTGHFWKCWGSKDGPGAQFRTEVQADLAAIKLRIAYFAGGVAVLVALVSIFGGSWMSSRFQAAERNAVKREDVVSAVQKGADMSAAKYGDDLMDLKKQIERAAVDAYVPPELMKARK